MVTLAHLKAIETRGDPTARYDWKMRLVKGLYDRGFTKERMRRLFHVMSWVMKLPPILNERLSRDIKAFEKERRMPLLTPMEEMWQEEGVAKGLRKAIEKGLARRHGPDGLALMPRINEIMDVSTLDAFLDAFWSAPDIDALRALLPPQA